MSLPIIMAMASPKLLFLFVFLLLPLFTYGTQVGFSYHAKGNNAATLSFLNLNKVSSSQLRVFSSLSHDGVPVDLYLSQTSLISSNSCATSSQLVNHVKIGSIIISQGQGQDLDLPMLLATLRSIHSGLINGVKVSAAFSLPFLENLSITRARDLHRICSFIKKAGSAITVEDSIIGELSMGDDEFAHKMVQITKLAVSLFSGTDVPIVVTVATSAVPNPTQVAEVSNKICKYLENNSEIGDRVEGVYAVIERPSSHRQLHTSWHDEITPPNTVFPTTPISTTPITIPPDTPFVTVPSTTPVPVTTDPGNSPVPITNPVTTPAVTNPVTTYPAPAANVPVPVPNGQQSWCVAKNGAPESSVQTALDYACGIGGADCTQIQQTGSCFNPITLQQHASYAFNSYYQKNPSPSSCDFGGTATITNTNPSTGSCIFPSSSSSSSTSTITPPSTTSTITPPSNPPPQISTPTPITTPTPTPTTSSSSGAAGVTGSGPPPMVPNLIDPASGTPTVFGSEVPPSVNTSTTSISPTLQPLLGCCIFLLTSFVAQIIVQ